MTDILPHSQSRETGRGGPDYDRVHEFLTVLSKGIKTSLLYPADNPIPLEFKRSCWQKLNAYLQDIGRMEFDVLNDAFCDRNHEIFKAPSREENLPGIMHRDGIRRISFKADLQKEEWERFFDDILTVVKDREGFEDLVNLFWQRDFANIEYDAVDDFSTAEINDSYQRIPESPDLVYAEVLESETMAEDGSPLDMLNPEYQNAYDQDGFHGEDINQIFHNIHQFGVEERNYIESLVSADEELIIEFEAIDLLMDILLTEEELSKFDETVNTLDNVFDRMLDSQQYPLLVYLVKKMKAAYKPIKEVSSNRADKFADSLARFGDRIRISKITNTLNSSPNTDLEGIRMYLEELDWNSLPALIWMLGELEYFPARRMLIEALVNKGRSRIDIIGNAVFDSRWYVIRNAALILGEVGGDQALEYLRKPLEHFDERVRWEAVVAIEKISTPEAYSRIVPLLRDESDRVRGRVLAILDKNGYKPAFEHILAIVQSAQFGDFEHDEQKKYIRALATTGGDEAVGPLRRIIKKWSLFSSEVLEMQKEAAVHALAGLASEHALAVLEEAGKKNNPAGRLARLFLEKLKSGDRLEGELDK